MYEAVSISLFPIGSKDGFDEFSRPSLISVPFPSLYTYALFRPRVPQEMETDIISRDSVKTGLPRKGFGVPVQVAVERSDPGPILQPCAASDGGVQGLRWYSMRLKMDEDRDVADEFLEDHHNYKTLPKDAKQKLQK